jgi:hypothetical protein
LAIITMQMMPNNNWPQRVALLATTRAEAGDATDMSVSPSFLFHFPAILAPGANSAQDATAVGRK